MRAGSRPDAQLGEEMEVEVTPADFGRIASQNAKQALMQHIRRAEKAVDLRRVQRSRWGHRERDGAAV